MGEDGEIWCRGETVMLGYYKDPEATRQAITDDGWLRTGDIGRFDAQSYLSITGRLKDMFKTGGTNAYPVEIEQHLALHPAIAQSVVVGVPDQRLDEVWSRKLAAVFLRRRCGRTHTEGDLNEKIVFNTKTYGLYRHCIGAYRKYHGEG